MAEEMLKTRLMTLGSTVPLPRASSDLRANLCTPVWTAANGRECGNAAENAGMRVSLVRVKVVPWSGSRTGEVVDATDEVDVSGHLLRHSVRLQRPARQ